ncbi:probable cytochrome P450 6a13 [Cloeon dipterum]|uniref:probable cytochrome P450 6a13 n=1 Tax=Cloeon dipterum TaxID=197152 RepID=UPI0032202BB8
MSFLAEMLGLEEAVPFSIKVTIALCCAVLYLSYKFVTKHSDYWHKQGVKFIKPVPIFGSVASNFLLKEHLSETSQRWYKENAGQPFIGYFRGRSPTLMIFDPELIKQIFIKDFSHFSDRGFQFNEETDPLRALNLFNLGGQRWREMRSKLVPTFTSGKMKGMFPLMVECSKQFDEHLQLMADRHDVFEAKDLLGCLFTDIIGSCIFGVKCNAIKEPKNVFRVMGKRLVDVKLFQALKVFFAVFQPEVARILKIRTMDEEVQNFFINLTRDMIQHRKKNSIVRNDFLQLLMELKDKGRVTIANDDEDASLENENFQESYTPFRFDDTDLAAQATIFFLAGFETSSSAVSFALLELAVNPDIQRKAHSEIDEQLAKCDGKITYETLKEMKYLEWIADETLRKYPAVAVHFRMCNKKYTLPGKNITLEKGMHVAIPNYALQNDPKYFANPKKFDPERFSSDDILNKLQHIYTPFGLGPRQCIGNRFAMVQTKLALLTFLQKYTVSICEKTRFPVKFDAKQFIPTAKDGIWLQIKKRG